MRPAQARKRLCSRHLHNLREHPIELNVLVEAPPRVTLPIRSGQLLGQHRHHFSAVQLLSRVVTQLLLGNTPSQEPVAHNESHVNGLMSRTLRRVDDELGILDEVARVAVFDVVDVVTEPLDFVQVDHPASPRFIARGSCYQRAWTQKPGSHLQPRGTPI